MPTDESTKPEDDLAERADLSVAQAMLAEPGRRWLLLVGGRLGATAGVPQPFERTRWAPSLADLVTQHLFRTQSRRAFEGMAAELERGEAPVGYISDTLDGQAEWVAEQLTGLEPNRAMLRAADLARAGMFQVVLSNSVDRLLNKAFDAVGVSYRQATLEDSAAKPDCLQLLREWDDRVFADTQDRRDREAQFVRERMATHLAACDGVLVLGMRPERCELVEALAALIEERPEVAVAWIDEDLWDDGEAPLRQALATGRQRFEHERVSDLGAFLDAVATARGVPKTPVTQEPPKSLVKRMLGASWDLKPVLVYVPGLGLFDWLINKMPRLSFASAVSFMGLLVLIFGYFQWDIWVQYDEQAAPVAAHLDKAKAALALPDKLEGALRAEAEVSEGQRKHDKILLPYENLLSIEDLHDEIEELHEEQGLELKYLRDFEVTPVLYRARLDAALRADPSRAALSNHPPLPVTVERPEDFGPGRDRGWDPRSIEIRRRPLAAYRLPGDLAEHDGEQRLALLAQNPSILRVTMQTAALTDLKAERLPVLVDLAEHRSGPLEQHVLSIVQRIAGYVGERAGLFDASGVLDWMERGAVTLYFLQLEASGVTENLARIRDMAYRFPKCRFVLGAHEHTAQVLVARRAEGYRLVSLGHLRWSRALAFLREHTSPAFARGVMQDGSLRSGLSDPLVLSLLIDYFRFAGVPPESLAEVYDRLLLDMLGRGKSGFAPKLLALGHIAWAIYASDDHLTRERAAKLIGDVVYHGRFPEKAATLLAEMVEDGVLRVRAGIWVTFMDERFKQLAVAKHLEQLPPAQRLAFLLARSPDIAAFHGGTTASVDPLLGAILEDYEAAQAELAKHGQADTAVNPYLATLSRAALLAQNGRPSPALVRRLEDALFELIRHRTYRVPDAAMRALTNLSTPHIRRWVLVGLDGDTPWDEQLLQFTSSASEEIYIDPIDRWLTRVMTPGDGRREERVRDQGGDRPVPRHEVRVAFEQALETLVRTGDPKALEVVRRTLGRSEDPRFPPDQWNEIRRHIVQTLLANERFDAVRAHLDEIAAAPDAWSSVLFDLYVLNDQPTAEALAKVLAQRRSRKARPYDKSVRSAAEAAATALALMDERVAVPALENVLAAGAPSDDKVDYLPYVWLSFAYRGDSERVPELVAFARTRQAARHLPKPYFGTLSKALASFGSPAAAQAFGELMDDPGWTSRDGNIAFSLRHLRGVGGEELAMRALLCGPKEKVRLVGQLGMMRTPTSREALNLLLRVLDKRHAAEALLKICGEDRAEAAEQRVRAWGAGGTARVVEALATIYDEQDLPRFARWAVHPEPAVREAARRALRSYREPAAVSAVIAGLDRFPEETDSWLRTLGAQARPEAERRLLELLAAPERVRDPRVLVAAVGKTGRRAALLKLIPLQLDPKLGKMAQQAVHEVAKRSLGSFPTRTELITAFAALAPPAPEAKPKPEPATTGDAHKQPEP